MRLSLELQATARFEEGRKVGREDATEEAKQKIEPVLQNLAQSIACLSSMKAQIRRQAEQELLRLVMAVSRRVVHRELTLDPEAILALLHVGLDRITHAELTAIRVHPEHAPRIRERLLQVGVSDVEVHEDAELRVGDIVFETAMGSLDATLESQFLEIERGFADRL
jgi:flagellar assembly protein FliH